MIVAKNGRYGPYVTEVLPEDAPKSRKPRTSSLFKSMNVDTITLEDALRLLTLPRVVGVDPESGDEITAQNGRYGPYLKKGTDSRSIESEEQLLTISLEEALRIYAQPKQRGRAAANPGRELGEDPATGAKITVKAGRFGAYVTDGEYNATIPRADDENADHARAGRRAARRAARQGPGEEVRGEEDGEEVDRQEDRGQEDGHQEEGRGEEVLTTQVELQVVGVGNLQPDLSGRCPRRVGRSAAHRVIR